MKPYASAGEKDDKDIFTEKQCHVLDLLIEHKTSKEIARALGISPYTVDQRISLARAKLGVASRNELAARYRVMRRTPGQSSPDLSAFSQAELVETEDESDPHWSTDAPDADAIRHPESQVKTLVPSANPAVEETPCPTTGDFDYRVGPEVFEGRSGGLWRLGAIVATALLLVVTILGLFAIFNQLNAMLS